MISTPTPLQVLRERIDWLKKDKLTFECEMWLADDDVEERKLKKKVQEIDKRIAQYKEAIKAIKGIPTGYKLLDTKSTK